MRQRRGPARKPRNGRTLGELDGAAQLLHGGARVLPRLAGHIQLLAQLLLLGLRAGEQDGRAAGGRGGRVSAHVGGRGSGCVGGKTALHAHGPAARPTAQGNTEAQVRPEGQRHAPPAAGTGCASQPACSSAPAAPRSPCCALRPGHGAGHAASTAQLVSTHGMWHTLGWTGCRHRERAATTNGPPLAWPSTHNTHPPGAASTPVRSSTHRCACPRSAP